MGLCQYERGHVVLLCDCVEFFRFLVESKDHAAPLPRLGTSCLTRDLRSFGTSTACSDHFGRASRFFDVGDEGLDRFWHDAEGDLGAVVNRKDGERGFAGKQALGAGGDRFESQNSPSLGEGVRGRGSTITFSTPSP